MLLSSAPCSLPDDDVLARVLMPHAHGPHAHGPHAHGPHSAPGPSASAAPPTPMPSAAPPASGAASPAPAALLVPPAEIQSLRASVREGRCQRIQYRSEGLTVVGFVLEPPRPKPAPAILVARGGNRDLGKIGPRLLLDLNALADEGFVIVATQYRGADGGEGKDEFGGADLADLENLAPLARSLPSVDSKNLFLLGYSRGGMMAAMALRKKLPVRAAALFSGLYDLEDIAAKRPEMEQNFIELIPGYEAHRVEELKRRSALSWASEIEAPVLLLGGTRDTRVSFDANARRLGEALSKAGREAKLVGYDDDHTLDHFRAESTKEIAAWFRAHLTPQSP